MSRIICDVCGTSYQASAAQCPICGCVRANHHSAPAEIEKTTTERNGTYTYVKGGRFSKANVQKRNKGLLPETPVNTTHESATPTQSGNKSDKGLVIAVCALLLAIIAVVIYIAIHFFASDDTTADQPTLNQDLPTLQTTEQTVASTADSNISCTDVVLSSTEVSLDAIGSTYALGVIYTPADTTDVVVFASADESVATVSESGIITLIGEGETVITVSCGEVSAQCRVVSAVEVEPTVAQTEPVTPGTEFNAPFKINKTDVSISVGETFLLKLIDANGQIVPVSWSATIADICTVDGNSVTGAMKGKTELSATYNGETFTCIIRVR